MEQGSKERRKDRCQSLSFAYLRERERSSCCSSHKVFERELEIQPNDSGNSHDDGTIGNGIYTINTMYTVLPISRSRCFYNVMRSPLLMARV